MNKIVVGLLCVSMLGSSLALCMEEGDLSQESLPDSEEGQSSEGSDPIVSLPVPKSKLGMVWNILCSGGSALQFGASAVATKASKSVYPFDFYIGSNEESLKSNNLLLDKIAEQLNYCKEKHLPFPLTITTGNEPLQWDTVTSPRAKRLFFEKRAHQNDAIFPKLLHRIEAANDALKRGKILSPSQKDLGIRAGKLLQEINEHNLSLLEDK